MKVQQTHKIKTRKDLANFIKLLQQDFANNPGAWENQNLEDYLEALSAWTMDMEGYFENLGCEVPEEPSWRLIGEMLLASKQYE